jgi:hypothetical protein
MEGSIVRAKGGIGSFKGDHKRIGSCCGEFREDKKVFNREKRLKKGGGQFCGFAGESNTISSYRQ